MKMKSQVLQLRIMAWLPGLIFLVAIFHCDNAEKLTLSITFHCFSSLKSPRMRFEGGYSLSRGKGTKPVSGSGAALCTQDPRTGTRHHLEFGHKD